MTAPAATPTAANAAVLWTGGKDSALALHEARRNGCRVDCLLTFAPPEPNFLAHPINVMKLQAKALGLPHLLWPVQAPFAESYEAGLRRLREACGIDTVITGDIAEVAGQPNWIRERSRAVGMNVLTPLWGRDRVALLRHLVESKFQVIFSCIKTPWLTPAWIGRLLDEPAIAELRALRARNGLDLCGEEGEYHTLVADAPDFQQRLQFDFADLRQSASMAWWKIHHAELIAKP